MPPTGIANKLVSRNMLKLPILFWKDAEISKYLYIHYLLLFLIYTQKMGETLSFGEAAQTALWHLTPREPNSGKSIHSAHALKPCN